MAELYTKLPYMTPVKAILIGYDGVNMQVIRSDSSGVLSVNASVSEDPLILYKAADIDIAADTKYYGFIDKDGNWYIMREITTAGSFRFCKGTSAYTTAWTAKTSQSYDYFYTIF